LRNADSPATMRLFPGIRSDRRIHARREKSRALFNGRNRRQCRTAQEHRIFRSRVFLRPGNLCAISVEIRL